MLNADLAASLTHAPKEVSTFNSSTFISPLSHIYILESPQNLLMLKPKSTSYFMPVWAFRKEEEGAWAGQRMRPERRTWALTVIRNAVEVPAGLGSGGWRALGGTSLPQEPLSPASRAHYS